ncbi:MAG: PadR family transcriptional regulator [Chloroflexi bacterium]|nr:MAG: PadR family transcriptional regulator [Chloroflexota bacterium]
MAIEHAILGLLSWRPLSGYDLKKKFADSLALPWSGNNNQIYNSLVRLHEDGLVTQEIQYQENLPARKVYTITDKGRADLRQWVLTTPELPELHSPFLIQLAFTGVLTDEEIDGLLAKYEDEIDLELRMQQEKARRVSETPDRSPREAFLWKKIVENRLDSYQHELDWVLQVGAEFQGLKKDWEVGKHGNNG